MRKWLELGVWVALLGAGLSTGCSSSSDSAVTPHGSGSSGSFSARAVHASPDAPTVDIFANGIKGFAGASFFGVTPFQSLAAGSVNVEVFPASSGSARPSGSPVISTSLTVPANASETIAVGGLVAPTGSQQPLRIFAFQDDVTPTAGSAEVRIIHLSPDAPTVDVRVGNNDPRGSLLATIPYGQATASNLALPPGTYTVSVFAAGTTTFAGSGTFSVEANRNYTVFAVGLLGNGTFQLQPRQDS